MGDVTPLPRKWAGSHAASRRAHNSNGAREALQNLLCPVGATDDAIDILLMCLWKDGFKIIPLTDEDKAEGRSQ